MRVRDYAIVVFYDKDLNIAVQERGAASKMGEKYAFWGGQIENGETPKKAAIRELIEELSYRPKKLEYWGNYSFTITERGRYHGYLLNVSVFISPITLELEKTKVSEGSGLVKLSIEEVIQERGFLKGINKFMPKLKLFLEKKR